MTEEQLIAACKREEAHAQKAFYDRFAPRMLGLCCRYLRDRQEAEDILLQGMFKAFTHIGQFSGEGSLEGWLRRIMVNEALMHLRKRREQFEEPETIAQWHSTKPEIDGRLDEDRLLELLDKLPPGYRTVFNLYAIEGYKHREIAELLGISINTSKSQLLLARRKLKEWLSTWRID